MDVAATVGAVDEYDGRAVALADLANRGALDVIVANQGQPAVVYRAEPDPENHWIAFALLGLAMLVGGSLVLRLREANL